MKVTLVSAVNPSVPVASGVKSYVLSLAHELVKLHQDVTLIGVGTASDEPYEFEFLPVAPRLRNSFEFTTKLARFIRGRISPDDVIHAQRPDDLLPFHLQAGENPKVLTMHGVHGTHVAAKRGRFVAAGYELAERVSIARADAIVCVSPHTLAHFRSRYPASASRLHLIPAGVDLEIFRPGDRQRARDAFGFSENARVAAFVGRFEPEKNPVAIVDEFLKLPREWEGASLVLVGNGRLSEDLMEMATVAPDRIAVRSPLQHHDLVTFLNAIDVLVIASSVEGLPTVAIEALACGIPVVGTRVGILPQVIRDGVNGYLVDSVNELHTRIESAFQKGLWHREACRASILDFGWDKVAGALLGIYREIST